MDVKAIHALPGKPEQKGAHLVDGVHVFLILGAFLGSKASKNSFSSI